MLSAYCVFSEHVYPVKLDTGRPKFQTITVGDSHTWFLLPSIGQYDMTTVNMFSWYLLGQAPH